MASLSKKLNNSAPSSCCGNAFKGKSAFFTFSFKIGNAIDENEPSDDVNPIFGIGNPFSEIQVLNKLF